MNIAIVIHQLHLIEEHFDSSCVQYKILLVHMIILPVRDDNYGWAVVEKSTNQCVVRWVLNSFYFYLLSYKIIDMYIQRLNFSYYACICLLFRLVTKSSVPFRDG